MVGSADVMARQMRHLAAVAAMPNVTLQVLPALAHPATQSGFMIADDAAAYAEHVTGGFVYTDAETVTGLRRLFDTYERKATVRPKVRQSSERLVSYGLAKVKLLRSQRGAVLRDSYRRWRCPGPRHHRPRRRNTGFHG
jgi:uncharacterized protein DUF5753